MKVDFFSFDAREHWKNCSDIIDYIRDQSACVFGSAKGGGLPRPRKARGATAPLTTELVATVINLRFLNGCPSHLKLTN
ncbi:hypothetical protein Y032_0119g814 [Ancylostoma ceylanicum]|uniref:Uncharacterized protein n=1 Tax=Ancylostoma ceylanicum TaxID=53326 RepID=A0A016TB67_9BILA|nr:hypothetical protein Y032_0119g814 [Ancylostoma ceylanicum]